MDGSPTVANPYHYADNDPLNRVDPTGLRGTDADHRCIKGITGTSEITGLTPSPGSGRLDLPGPGGVIGSGPIIVLPGKKAGGGSVDLGGGPGICLKPPPGGTKIDPRLAAAAIVAAAAILASQWFADINNPGGDGRGSDECSPSEGAGLEVSDGAIVVRGGTGPLPPPCREFSGSFGMSFSEAARGVPHGQVSSTTAGAIRAGGGSVIYAPEYDPVPDAFNYQHVTVVLGHGSAPFGPLQQNPWPKDQRWRGANYPYRR